MKTLVGTLLAVSIFVSVAVGFDSQYKTRLITSATLTIHVKDGQYIVIRNFTQDQAAGQRGVLVAGVIPATPTPTPTPTATTTPNPTPTPSTFDLTAIKSHDPAGIVTFPNPWTWKIHVANGANAANASASFTSGQTILTDNLPNGINYGSASVANQVNIVANPSAISCVISGGNDLNCTALNNVTINSGGSFDVSFTATPTAPGTYANPSGGTCMVDPDNDVTAEADENNNTCADTVNANLPNPTPTPIFAPVLVATILNPVAIVNGGPTPRPTGEFIKPIIVAGPATLTIDPVPPATLAVTYRKGLQPIQPTPTATVTSATSSTSSSFSTSTSARTSTITRSTTVTLSNDDEIEWSTPTPTPSPTPTASPRLRTATTPTPTATPLVTPTATPQSH